MNLEVSKLNLSTGEIEIAIPIDNRLYYKMLSSECGVQIQDDYSLMKYVKELVQDKQEYDKIRED